MPREKTGSVITRTSLAVRLSLKDKTGKTKIVVRKISGQSEADLYVESMTLEAKKNGDTDISAVLRRESMVYARVRYVDKFGRTRSIEQKAKNRSDAKAILKRLIRRLDDEGVAAIEAEKATFNNLAILYKQRRLVPAEYALDQSGNPTTKQRGLRSLQSPLRWWEIINQHFGMMRLRNLTYSDIEDFKLERLRAPTQQGTARSITSVNRELELLRAMLNFAVQNELLTSSPFKKGPPLISKADEKRRDRVLTPAEEFRLLAVCTEPVNVEYERKGKKIIATYENRRDLLRAIVIAALDTGLRKNELLTLRWSDVDLDSRLISILAFNSKTARPRTVGITARLSEELQRIRERTAPAPVNLVFDVRDKLGRSLGDNLGRHFRAACVDAAIEGLSFHDLRHTATTRMVQAGLPAPMIMKITGHSQMATFQRYVNPDGHSVQNVADVLSAFNRQNEVAVQAERPEQEYAN